MKNTPDKTPSPFSLSALDLDKNFSELEKLREGIERIDIESEKGLQSITRLLKEFGECGIHIAEMVQALAQNLAEAKVRAEETSRIVAERALQVEARQKHLSEIYDRYRVLGTRVAEVSSAIGQFKKPVGESYSAEERAYLPGYLSDVDHRIENLISEAEELKNAARENHMDSLVRELHALAQSLGSVRRKLVGFTGEHQARA